jgi:hypothetical protein
LAVNAIETEGEGARHLRKVCMINEDNVVTMIKPGNRVSLTISSHCISRSCLVVTNTMTIATAAMDLALVVGVMWQHVP